MEQPVTDPVIAAENIIMQERRRVCIERLGALGINYPFVLTGLDPPEQPGPSPPQSKDK